MLFLFLFYKCAGAGGGNNEAYIWKWIWMCIHVCRLSDAYTSRHCVFYIGIRKSLFIRQKTRDLANLSESLKLLSLIVDSDKICTWLIKLKPEVEMKIERSSAKVIKLHVVFLCLQRSFISPHRYMDGSTCKLESPFSDKRIFWITHVYIYQWKKLRFEIRIAFLESTENVLSVMWILKIKLALMDQVNFSFLLPNVRDLSFSFNNIIYPLHVWIN